MYFKNYYFLIIFKIIYIFLENIFYVFFKFFHYFKNYI